MSNFKYQIHTKDWSLEIRNWKLPVPRSLGEVGEISRLSGAGFTLIELLVVVSLMGVMMFATLVSYTDYTSRQTLRTSADELRETLTLAKSRAFSQVKPQVCGNDTLEGYKVQICKLPGSSCFTSGSDYELHVVCGGQSYLVSPPSPDAAPKRLPQNVTVDEDRTDTTSFFFPILAQGVEKPGKVTLSGFGKTFIIITVDALGNISFSS
ncbi:MAG: prepilin-type N-terminal cleavage/methylation domain-containing protein [Candidatus Levybacteria bacterium]|nr:prepilin-type N-terminal cleavage/methylation domain-containing protein [Candidatus Levybacteria bacterium]